MRRRLYTCHQTKTSAQIAQSSIPPEKKILEQEVTQTRTNSVNMITLLTITATQDA